MTAPSSYRTTLLPWIHVMRVMQGFIDDTSLRRRASFRTNIYVHCTFSRLQHAATQSSLLLQHTATHCNTHCTPSGTTQQVEERCLRIFRGRLHTHTLSLSQHIRIPSQSRSCVSWLRCMCCSVLQCAAMCCSVLHCVAACCSLEKVQCT